jgi:hypothetical protein
MVSLFEKKGKIRGKTAKMLEKDTLGGVYLLIDHANHWSLTSLVFVPQRLDLLGYLDLIWYEPSQW